MITPEPGTLYVCATPIGNLSDITLRVLEVLGAVDLIAAEDTRHSRKLLTRYEIKTPVTSYHEHNERSRTPELLERLTRGQNIALISDAGLPGISDPGSVLIAACREQGIPVDVLPGATAAVTALVASGLPSHTYFYGGFLPVGKKRQEALRSLVALPCTLILYEAPHRLTRTLRDLRDVLGDRETAVCRELTKIHQQVHRGTLGDLLDEFTKEAPRGECCLVIAPPAETVSGVGVSQEDACMGEGMNQEARNNSAELPVSVHNSVLHMWREFTDGGMAGKEAVKEVARRLGIPKRLVYQAVMIKENE